MQTAQRHPRCVCHSAKHADIKICRLHCKFASEHSTSNACEAKHHSQCVCHGAKQADIRSEGHTWPRAWPVGHASPRQTASRLPVSVTASHAPEVLTPPAPAAAAAAAGLRHKPFSNMSSQIWPMMLGVGLPVLIRQLYDSRDSRIPVLRRRILLLLLQLLACVTSMFEHEQSNVAHAAQLWVALTASHAPEILSLAAAAAAGGLRHGPRSIMSSRIWHMVLRNGASAQIRQLRSSRYPRQPYSLQAMLGDRFDHDCKAHLLQAALVGQDPADLAC